MPKIESVVKYKGSTYQVNFTEGEPAFINLDVISQFNLKSGVEMPDSAWEQILYANTFRKARERALYLLDYRDYSYVELFKKLEPNYDEDVCYDVVDSLAKVGIIDDRRYAENLAEKLMTVKKCGYYKAVQEMRLKGISKELADRVLAEYEDSTVERIVELLSTKYARKLSEENGVTKVKNALARQGYSYSQINEALQEFSED